MIPQVPSGERHYGSAPRMLNIPSDSNSYDLAVITDPADPSIVTGLTGSGTIENGGKIQVVYSKDENGDHVPDKYQTEVYFKVVNGSWNDETNNPEGLDCYFNDRWNVG